MPKSFSDNGGDPSAQSGTPQGSFANNKPLGQDNDQDGNNANDNNQIDLDKINKRLNDKDEFINKLQGETSQYRQEIDSLREELGKRPNLDEIMEHINQQAGATPTNIDPDELINRAVAATESRLTEKQKAERQQSNIKSVSTTLSQAFQGEDLDKKVAELAAENDMSFDDVFDLAARNPKAALKLLGVRESSKPSSNGNNGSINTLALHNQNGNGQNKPEGHILSKRTDRERVDYFKRKMDEGLKQFNQ